MPEADPLPFLLGVGIKQDVLTIGQHALGCQAPLGEQEGTAVGAKGSGGPIKPVAIEIDRRQALVLRLPAADPCLRRPQPPISLLATKSTQGVESHVPPRQQGLQRARIGGGPGQASALGPRLRCWIHQASGRRRASRPLIPSPVGHAVWVACSHRSNGKVSSPRRCSSSPRRCSSRSLPSSSASWRA
jgi:hypothetical protein